jgi:hypothetical protein
MDPILWILGGPGSGKSFLATRIISDLCQRFTQGSGDTSKVTVVYFFIKEDDQYLHDLNTILKSIAFQIAVADVIYKKHILEIHDSHESCNSARSTWVNLFIKFFNSTCNLDHSVFIVIDGLDEAPEQTRKGLFELLKFSDRGTSSTPHPRMQFCILGRPEIRDDIHVAHRKRSIEISSQKNRDDVSKYIKEELKNVTILYHMRRPAAKIFAKQIHDSILQGADGMFLWAKLVLAQIYKKERKSEILAALKDAPRELDGVIRRVFERLERDPDVNRLELNRILAWVTCARRPLLLGELDVILSILTGEANLVLRDRLRGKFASIMTLMRVERDEETDDEPSLEVNDEPPNIDFFSIDDLDDSTVVDNELEDGPTSIGQDDNLLPDTHLQNEFSTTQVVFSHKRIKDYVVESNFIFSDADALAVCKDA